MGCRLPKLRRAEERRSPGKIYSTLRRPQVETKVGVAYTYHFLDFLLGKEEVPVSSVLCLSSVRELPLQVRDLYAQGFVLVALHPFVHPCGPRHARVQRQLHRAVLVRETHSQEKTQLKWAGHRLETDVCVAGHQVPDPEMIQNYVKKVQDVSEQGVLFVGFLQQPGGGPCYLGHWDPEDLSSLHSSPSPIHRNPAIARFSPTEPRELHQNLPEHRNHHLNHVEQKAEHNLVEPRESDLGSLESAQVLLEHSPEEPTGRAQKQGSVKALKNRSNYCLKEQDESVDQERSPADRNQNPETIEPTGYSQGHSPTETACLERRDGRRAEPTARTEPDLNPDTQNQREGQDPGPDRQYQKPERTYLDHNGDYGGDQEQDRRSESGSETQGSAEGRSRHGDGIILDASHLEELHRNRATPHNNNHIRVKRSERENTSTPPAQTRMQLFALYNHVGELCSPLSFYSLRVPLRVHREAGLVTEVDAHWLDHMTQHFTSGARLVDGFFHLGEDSDSGVSSVDSVFIFQSSSEETTPTSYDAIVVEQWTIVDGVVVRTDYIPLLQSLAPFGWRLMCVLPTPIVKANSDGSLSTKQILFLQRPTLQRKRKDFKKLNLRGRNKAKRSAAREAPEKKEEGGNASPLTERGMDRAGKNAKEEEEEEGRESWKNRENRKKDRECPRRDGEGGKENSESRKDTSPGTDGAATDANRQEETAESGGIPPANQEKSLRWTDRGEREKAGDKEERKAEMAQLSDRALFSGVC